MDYFSPSGSHSSAGKSRIAGILATHRAGGLSLKGLWDLTEDTAQELVRHPMLCLDGVNSISDGVAKILGRYDREDRHNDV